MDVFNSKRFTVDKVVEILSRPECTDKVTLEKIKGYIKKLERSQLKMTITLLERQNEQFIIDGNTSTVAYFEYCRREGRDANLSVFIIAIWLICCFKLSDKP